MKVLVIITSYERPKMLNKLIKQLSDCDIIIYDDNSTFDYFKIKYKFIRFEVNYGKKKAWEKFNIIFKDIPNNYDYYIMLPDDIQVKPNFIEDTVNLYKSIRDTNKICMSLMTDERILKPNWTGVAPKMLYKVVRTQWVDMCFISEYKFFKDVYIKPISLHRWTNHPLLGSGVGQEISKNLHRRGYTMFHSRKSMVKQGGHPSLMNPEAAKKRYRKIDEV